MAEPESLNTMFQNSFVKLGDGSYALQTSGGAVAPDSVDTAAIQDGAVTTPKIADANVTLAKMASDSVDSSKIVDGTIAVGDLATAVVNRLLLVRAAAQANSTATDVAGIVADFNALLAKLRTAGVIAP